MKIEKQSPENLQIELEDRLLCSAQINDESGIKSNVGTLKTPDLLSVNHVPTSQQLVTAIKSRNSERVKTFLFTAVDASTAALIGNAGPHIAVDETSSWGRKRQPRRPSRNEDGEKREGTESHKRRASPVVNRDHVHLTKHDYALALYHAVKEDVMECILPILERVSTRFFCGQHTLNRSHSLRSQGLRRESFPFNNYDYTPRQACD